MTLRPLALFLSLGLVLVTAGPGHSLAQPTAAPDLMPLNPEIVRAYREAGRAVPFSSAEARFADRPNVRINRIARPTVLNATGKTAANATNATSVKAIVLLVKFTDNPPGGPTTRYNATVWDSMLFRDNYIRGGADTTTTRTLKSFFNAISYGTIDVVTLNLPSAVGWLTAPNNYAYYCQHDGTHDNGFGPYPRNVQRLVMDAVIAADPYVDFSQYAVGGVVQNLFIVHAGSGAEWSGGSDLIWSHAWSIVGGGVPALYVDGVQIVNYSMEPEAGGDTMGEGGAVSGPQLPTVGVYAHEFGHVLGLPDEYDYGYESEGTGIISLMAGGSWSRTPNIFPYCAGNSPARPSAWGMTYLGFVTPTVVTTPTAGITIPPIETTGPGSIYKLVQPGSGGMEYWLFENRQQLGFDAGFASMGTTAHGLCIYHVDENVLSRAFWRPNEAECVSGGVYAGQRNCDCATLSANPTNGEKWYGISVEQADGLYDLERGFGNGATDFFPNTTGKTSFTPLTVPNSSSYDTTGNCAGMVTATNIQEVGGNIILNLGYIGVPDIAVTPDSLTAELSIDQQTTRTLTIANTGDGDLNFTVAGALARALSVPVYPEIKLAKGELDPRLAVLGQGGPDLFGYTWRDSDQPGGPAFSWVDITGIGSPLTLSGDDATVTGVPIGFSFPFYGNTFSTVNVSTNGFLSFTSSSTAYSNYPLPSASAPGNLLAVLWNDLYVTQGSVYTHYDASRFVISYIGVPRLSAGSPQTFQVILYPSGRIVYQYLTCTGTWDTDATVGIQNATGSDGLTVEYNAAYLHNNLAVELGTMPDFLTVTPVSGTVPAGGSLDLTVTFDATGLSEGDYRADLAISSNDPDESTVLVPTHLHVVGPTGVGDGPVAALALALEPARPSPMRGTGRLGFVLPREARARLSILDLQGREVAVLADGVFAAGRHTATWDGRTERGSAPAGIYFMRLAAEGRVFSQRLVRLK